MDFYKLFFNRVGSGITHPPTPPCMVKIVQPAAHEGNEFGNDLFELYASVSLGYAAYFFFKAVNALLGNA